MVAREVGQAAIRGVEDGPDDRVVGVLVDDGRTREVPLVGRIDAHEEDDDDVVGAGPWVTGSGGLVLALSPLVRTKR